MRSFLLTLIALAPSAGVLGSFDLSRHWLLVGSFELRALRGAAEDSPLAERKSNRYAAAGVAYRF